MDSTTKPHVRSSYIVLINETNKPAVHSQCDNWHNPTIVTLLLYIATHAYIRIYMHTTGLVLLWYQ